MIFIVNTVSFEIRDITQIYKFIYLTVNLTVNIRDLLLIEPNQNDIIYKKRISSEKMLKKHPAQKLEKSASTIIANIGNHSYLEIQKKKGITEEI